MSFKEQYNLFSKLNKILNEFEVEYAKYTLHNTTKNFIAEHNLNFEPYSYDLDVYNQINGNREGRSYLLIRYIDIYDKDGNNLDQLVKSIKNLDDDDKEYWSQIYVTDYVDVPVGLSSFKVDVISDFNLKEKIQGVINEF